MYMKYPEIIEINNTDNGDLRIIFKKEAINQHGPYDTNEIILKGADVEKFLRNICKQYGFNLS